MTQKEYPVLRPSAEQQAAQKRAWRADAAARETERRQEMFQRYPLMRLASDLAAQVGRPELEGVFFLDFEIVQGAMWSHPQDSLERQCWNELVSTLVDVPADALPDVRAFMRKARDGFGS